GDTVAAIVAGLEQAGAAVAVDPETDLLTVNQEFTLSLVVARSLSLASGQLRWKIRLDTGLKPDLSAVLRMNAANEAPLDYLLLPRIDIGDARLRLAEDNGLWIDAYRTESLEPLYRMSERVKLRSVA